MSDRLLLHSTPELKQQRTLAGLKVAGQLCLRRGPRPATSGLVRHAAYQSVKCNGDNRLSAQGTG